MSSSQNSVFRLALAPALAIAAICATGTSHPASAGEAAMPNGVLGKGAIDITGQWQRYPIYTLGFTDPSDDPNKKMRQEPHVPPPMGEPPLKPAYMKDYQAMQAKAREANAAGKPLNSQVVNCLPEGMPTMMGPTFPMEILQTRGMITVIEEAYTQVRHIYLNQKLPPDEDIDPTFYGTSVGHWENGVLKVTTVGIKEDVKLRNVPHSADMRIDEEIKEVAPGIVWDTITITDPMYLEKPWTYTDAWSRMKNYKLQEYICEDNREFTDQNGVQQQKITQ
jgi:hypothetical protein